MGQEPPCIQDPWTRSLLDHYDRDWNHPNLRLEVFLVATLANIDTAQIEARHASVRRDVMSRVQTTAMALARASSSFVLRGIVHPNLLLHELLTIGQAKHFRAAEAVVPVRRRGGGGGPWRLFCSTRGRGGRELLNTSALSMEYRALSAEEQQDLRDRGKDATALHKQGVAAFGLTDRDVQRASARARRRTDRERARAAASAILDENSTQALAIVRPSASFALQHNFEDSDLRRLRKLSREGSAVIRLVASECNSSLVKWSTDYSKKVTSEPGRGFLSTVEGFVSSSSPLPTEFPRADLFEFQVPMLKDIAMRACTVSARGDNELKVLRQALADDWDKKHKVIAHSTLPKLPKFATSSFACWKRGMCFCGDGGTILMAFGKSLQKLVRRHFSKQFKAPGRIHMENGRIAVLLMGEPEGSHSTSNFKTPWGLGEGPSDSRIPRAR
eukprot:5814810-Pyramimonas_sp.AAC.1